MNSQSSIKPENEDPRISEIRKVVLIFEDGHFQDYMIHENEVKRFVEACTKLYYDPGINPHTNGATKKLRRIDVAAFSFMGPFWWSTPDLLENHNPRGARVLDERNRHVVFSAG